MLPARFPVSVIAQDIVLKKDSTVTGLQAAIQSVWMETDMVGQTLPERLAEAVSFP